MTPRSNVIRFIVIIFLLVLAAVGHAQQEGPPKPVTVAELEPRLAGLDYQLQQALARIATLEQQVNPQVERERRKANREARRRTCQLRGLKLDRVSIDRDGKETVLCR